MAIEIRPEPLGSSVARELILELNRELDARYPEDGANHFRLDEDEVAPGRGVFLVAYDGEAAIGCGAFRVVDADVAAAAFGGAKTAEIKRMYMSPAARGRGAGRAMLEALEAAAQDVGVTHLVLETGERQHEAVGLYARAGFARIERFGDYVSSPLSLCMGKSLKP
jgi:putative acetyltransferase